MALGLSEAELIALFMESVLFGRINALTRHFFTHLTDLTGGFSVLFAATMYTLCYKRKMPDNKAILCVSILMYTLGLMVSRPLSQA